MKFFYLPGSVALVTALGLFAMSAGAGDAVPGAPAEVAVVAVAAVDAVAAISTAEVFASPVDADALAGYRGGAQTHNDMTLDGVTAGNTARNVATGDNSISSGSFANMSGLPIVVQNSGANVLIQNAVILNLQMN